MNDESFVFGGLTDEDPVLLIKLNDNSGINALGKMQGHDITATLDEDQQTMLKLNDYLKPISTNIKAARWVIRWAMLPKDDTRWA